MSTPIITIFVRHRPGCKWTGEEFHKGCKCRKHFRWSQGGKQYRKQAGTRSWVEAEENKRRLEAHLSGKTPEAPKNGQPLREAVDVFLNDKQAQGLTPDTLSKYKLQLGRLVSFCEDSRVFTVQGITLDLLVKFRGTWTNLYESSYTRSVVQKRLRVFLRFCHDAGWLAQVPRLSPIKTDEPPTLPLTDDEYARILKAIPSDNPKLRALVQLMRWSGLAVRDATMLKRTAIIKDGGKGGIYRIVVARQKTGTSVSVPIPPAVAAELLAVLNNPVYVFWDAASTEQWAAHAMSRAISELFTRAKIKTDGHMKSHRLRDTFAVDLLQKGVPLEEVSKLLGHESVNTTEKHYSKWVKGRQDRLDSLVIGAWDK